MIDQLKVVVVMPAYNAAKTLEKTVGEIDRNLVDHIILVDDYSNDNTALLAQSLGLQVIRHDKNQGYGGNQKTCYRAALEAKADIVVMVHPDYQYTPKLLPAMVGMLSNGLFDIVLGSRILGGGALRGGMPLYKYIFNRILTLIQNLLTGMKLSEFHTGYRVFHRNVLDTLPLDKNSDDFVFDNQFLVQAHLAKFSIGEITCPTHYFTDASSINFSRSLQYGLGCIWTSLLYVLAKTQIYTAPLFQMGKSSRELVRSRNEPQKN